MGDLKILTTFLEIESLFIYTGNYIFKAVQITWSAYNTLKRDFRHLFINHNIIALVL